MPNLPATMKKRRKPRPLIADFREGFAVGWRFAVPDAFRNALGITLVEVKSVAPDTGAVAYRNEWRQGKKFAFRPGSIFYDAKEAYTLTWGEALGFISLALQIKKIDKTGVTVTLHRPDTEKQSIVEFKEVVCSQQSLVQFLRTGVLSNSGHDVYRLDRSSSGSVTL